VYILFMNTKFIGIKDFRQNISDYVKSAQSSDTRFIVMNRNKPLFEIKPFAKDEYLDSFVASVLKAEAEVQAGKFHTEEEVMKELGVA
jgi:hypothetical protein